MINRLNAHDSEFAAQTRKAIKNMSPLSMGVTYETIKRGKSMSLHDVFEMEYKLSQGFMNHGEFFEGVRALLVEKDKNPKWTHGSMKELPQEDIENFFNRTD